MGRIDGLAITRDRGAGCAGGQENDGAVTTLPRLNERAGSPPAGGPP